MKLTLYNGKPWSIRERLKENVDILLNDMKESEMDLVIVIDGPEGTGKSFMARGIARYCATVLGSSFDVNDISFDIDTYIKDSLDAGGPDKLGRHKINVLDEARNVLNRKRGNSKVNVRFTNYLSECRALQQVHIIVLPAFHDLDKNIVLWRMSFLLHTVKNYERSELNDVGVRLKRGEYRLFINSAGGKKALAICYDMNAYQYPHQWEERNMWSSKEVFASDELAAYNEKKHGATLQKYYDEQKAQDTGTENKLTQGMKEWIRASEYADALGCNSGTVVSQIKDGRLVGKKINQRWWVHKTEAEKVLEQASIPEELI